MSTAAEQRRWRAKQRRAKRVAARDARELTRTFATDALAWAQAQPGSTASGLALRVAGLLDATDENEDPGTAALRRLAGSLGISDEVNEDEDVQRATALDVLERANEELEDGTADVATVRSGLQAARALAKTRGRVNVAAVDHVIRLALLGIYTDANGVVHDHREAPPWPSCCPDSRSLDEDADSE